MYTLKSKLPHWNLAQKKIILRADLNVPLKDGEIIDDFRLTQLKPTLDYILKNKGKIILLTHIGRPKNKEEELSTKQLIPWFKKNGYSVTFSPTIKDALKQSNETNNSSIILLENMRFFPEEQTGDNQFAKQLAQLGDYFVNDAFGALHRKDASVFVLPNYFATDKKSIGLLVQKELTTLNTLLKKQEQPFVAVIGGGKVADKIPLIESLLDSAQTIILGPAIVFSFLKAEGKNVGQSLVDPNSFNMCKKVLKQAQEKKVKIIMPIDFQVAHQSLYGPLSFTNTIAQNEYGISIGPKSIALFSKELKQAKTIFFNGLIGLSDKKETLLGAQELFKQAVESKAKVIVAGGDSVAIARTVNNHNTTYFSTGGGATLSYLTGKRLPALESLF